jgi:hypothetical protein
MKSMDCAHLLAINASPSMQKGVVLCIVIANLAAPMIGT